MLILNITKISQVYKFGIDTVAWHSVNSSNDTNPLEMCSEYFNAIIKKKHKRHKLHNHKLHNYEFGQ